MIVIMRGYLDLLPEKLWTLHPYNSTLTEVFDGERAWLVQSLMGTCPVFSHLTVKKFFSLSDPVLPAAKQAPDLIWARPH